MSPKEKARLLQAAGLQADFIPGQGPDVKGQESASAKGAVGSASGGKGPPQGASAASQAEDMPL